jgi:hypothetical protein
MRGSTTTLHVSVTRQCAASTLSVRVRFSDNAATAGAGWEVDLSREPEDRISPQKSP